MSLSILLSLLAFVTFVTLSSTQELTPNTPQTTILEACLQGQLEEVEKFAQKYGLPQNAADDDEKIVFGLDTLRKWSQSGDDMCVMMLQELPVWEKDFWAEQFRFLLKSQRPKVDFSHKTTFKLKACSSTGDPHIKEFGSGTNHYTQGTEPGEGLTLFRYRDFVIYVSTYGRGLTKSVAIQTEGHIFTVTAGKPATFDGNDITITTEPIELQDGLTVKLLGQKIVLSSPAGATVEIRPHSTQFYNVYVSVPENWIPASEGRCIHKKATTHVIKTRFECLNGCNDESCRLKCEDDDVTKKIDQITTLPWKSEELKQEAERICGEALELEQPYKDFCLQDVRLTGDIDAASSFTDVKRSLRQLQDIDNKEEHGARGQIFGTLAGLLETLKDTQEKVSKITETLNDTDNANLKLAVGKFLEENVKDISRLRGVQQEISREILKEEK